MSTVDIALRLRSNPRPKRYIDYTSMTNRTRRHSQASVSPQTPTGQQKAFKSASQKPQKTSHTVQSLMMPARSRPNLAGGYSSLALSAIQFADPLYEGVDTESSTVFIHEPTRKRKVISIVMYGLGMVVLGVSLFASVQTLLINRNAQEQVQVLGEQTYTTDANGVAEGTGSDPAESPVSENALLSYVPQNPQDPRYIRIPSLGVVSRVKTLGIDTTTGAVDAPRNIHDAGWYDGSVRPGSGPGTSLLLGHVSGWTAPGVFKKIEKLQNDETIIVENGEGRTFTYRVYKKETLHLDDIDMNRVLATEKAGEHDIKLMTCAGEFDSQSEEYDSRTIVYARQVL